jgi:hypothetical protein
MGAQRDIDQRAKYVAEAKSSTFLDAVYTITRYNGTIRPYALKQPPISAEEIFGDFSQEEFDSCCKRCVDLDRAAGEVAQAEYGYSGCTQSGEEAYKHFMELNSDFSGPSRGAALGKARIAFR